MIFVSVGTFIKGFDELVTAMDDACAQTGFETFAQIGNSSFIPRHMQYTRFLTADDMQMRLQQAQLVVCHGGLGIIGDAMRAQRPIIVVPRLTISNSPATPSNNQLAITNRLHDLYGINICVDTKKLAEKIQSIIRGSEDIFTYKTHCNVPMIVADFLKDTPRKNHE